MGVILYQTQDDGTDRVIAYAGRTLSKSERNLIAYASRTLSQSERNYPAYKLEFLALKWSVCDRFHEYLYGGNFEVFTDNNPLTYILTTAKLDTTGQRWVANLANYYFSIKYKSGKANVDTDALSRNPWDMQVNTAIVKSIINHEGTAQSPLYECYGPNTDLLHSEGVIVKGGQTNETVPPELNLINPKSIMTKEMLIKAQNKIQHLIK